MPHHPQESRPCPRCGVPVATVRTKSGAAVDIESEGEVTVVTVQGYKMAARLVHHPLRCATVAAYQARLFAIDELEKLTGGHHD